MFSGFDWGGAERGGGAGLGVWLWGGRGGLGGVNKYVNC